MAALPEDVPLRAIRLDVGATRPAMVPIVHIPLLAVGPLVLWCMEVEMNLGFQMGMIIDIPSVALVWLLCWDDHNAPRLWWVWANTTVKCLASAHGYGARAVTAFPIKCNRRQARGIPSDAW